MICDGESINKNIEYKQNYMLNYHVLDGMADWVRVVDKNSVVIFANAAMKSALGEDIVGIECYKAYCKDKKCSFCISNRSILTGETIQKEEIIDGHYYSVKSSPVTDENGEIYAAVEVFRDVTRERKLEMELINRNKRMRKDLQFAKRIQEKILPRKGTIENINIDYIYQASEMLSGDMFDIFYIDEQNIGIYISDVAGHGIAASMMTMFIRQTMRSIKDDILSPSLALSELHRRFTFLNLESDKYFTIFYGVYNKKTHEFRYSNAGHNCIPVKFNDGKYELLLMKGYPIALIFDVMHYEEKMIQLKPGDKILFYTDGITEAKDHNNVEFGVEGILETIKKAPNNLLQGIENKYIYHNWGEQDDDYALVLMEVMQ
jgi:sigma-B regulation protein RsbU (phosphoserine phosphatase)